jgi:hypothetical protein
VARRTVRMGIVVEGLPEARRVLRSLPDEARDEARAISTRISEQAVAWVEAAASTPQQQLALPSLRAVGGQIPGVRAGGSQRVTTSEGRSPTAGSVFFGGEFGGGARPTTQQFPPHRGRRGYWFWPTLRAKTGEMVEEWTEALDALAEKWRNRG